MCDVEDGRRRNHTKRNFTPGHARYGHLHSEKTRVGIYAPGQEKTPGHRLAERMTVYCRLAGVASGRKRGAAESEMRRRLVRSNAWI